jgi:hypothetical protein
MTMAEQLRGEGKMEGRPHVKVRNRVRGRSVRVAPAKWSTPRSRLARHLNPDDDFPGAAGALCSWFVGALCAR